MTSSGFRSRAGRNVKLSGPAGEAEASVTAARQRSLDALGEDLILDNYGMPVDQGAGTGTSQLSEEATAGLLRGLHAARGYSR